jgi:hypothetical protein
VRRRLSGRTRCATSQKMWEKGNGGMRMTANYIPGALWLLRWQTHTLRILLGLFDYGFLLRREVFGGHVRISGSHRHLK